MKNRKLSRLAATALAAVMAMGTVACGSPDDSPAQSGALQDSASGTAENSQAQAGGTSETGGVTSITLYPANANLSSGVVGGYVGEYFESQGLNIEVWAYSDEKTNAILASGDLPDIMYVTPDNLETMIDSGMVMQLDDHLDKLPHVAAMSELLNPAFNYIREYRSNGTNNVYAFPTLVGQTSFADSTDRNVIKLNWEIYEEIGAPEIKSFDDLIKVAKQMMDAHPTDENGAKIYGTILNSGSDATYWGNIILWLRWNNYMETQLPYLLEADMIAGEYHSILEDNSMYYQGLKFYFDCMQAGILDPDSINTDRATAGSKPRMFGGGTQPGWRDTYYEYWIPGTRIYFSPSTIYGDTLYGDTNSYIVINAKTEKLDACLKLIDIFADPDAQIMRTMGPDGDYWYTTEDGHLYLTDKAKNYLENREGNYVYDDGEEAFMWNTNWLLNTGELTTYKGFDEEPIQIMHTAWNEELQYTSNTATYNKWKETMGYESWTALLEDNNCLISDSRLENINSFMSTPDDNLQLTIDAIKDTVVDASWKMVYASSEQEFESIWKQMVEDCIGLGAQDVIDWRMDDIKKAMDISASM